jgi:plasmid replication initiation protein
MQAERDMSAPRRRRSARDQLDPFRALPGDLAPRDAQDLMAYAFFSLAKSKRIPPIYFHAGTITGDVLIWADSQIVEARDAGPKTSRLIAATPYGILAFVSRGTDVLDQSCRQQAVATGMPTARWLSEPDTIAPARVRVCPSATSLCKLRRTT